MIDLKLSNAEYHRHPAISKSGLDRINQSPAHYQSWLKEPRKETPAMTFGSAAHAFILEHATFLERYTVIPDGIDRRTKDGKAQWAEFEAQANGKTLIRSEDMQAIDAMDSAIHQHQSAAELLAEGIAEVSAFGNLWGVDVKCRPDWLREDGIVVDLKTTTDASPAAFTVSISKYAYYRQAAFYSDILSMLGIKVSAFIFIAVESSPPYAVGLYELDADSIELGRQECNRLVLTYKQCVESGMWPAYSCLIEPIRLPNWRFKNDW